MSSEQFSLRIPKEVKMRLESLAQATGRTKAFLALDAIEKYLEIEAWQIGAIQDGMKEVESGETVPIEKIKKNWNIGE